MKKTLIILAAVSLLLFLLYRFFAGNYNDMVFAEEKVEKHWANVESAYQRRLDLIPNIVSTVKGYAEFEKSTLEAVISARAKATSVVIDPTNITPEKLQQFQQAQDGISGALSRLLVTVEKYPELKANEGFMNLQHQLEGCENRISTERRNFNQVVQEYNSLIRSFPTNILAGLFGFDKKVYFEATAGAEKAPEVKF